MLIGREIKHRDTLVWCAGLPLVEERQLAQEERDQLKRAVWRLLWHGLGSFLSLAVLGTLLMVVVYMAGRAWAGTLFVIVVIFASLIVFLPVSLFAHESWTQRSLSLFRDLRRGEITVFAGQLTESDLLQTEDAADAAQSHLLALELLTLDSTQPQTIEVLSASRRVWRVNGEQVEPWVEAELKEVAVAGEAVSPWLHASRPAATKNGVGYRRLSERERVELFREARQHWLRPLVPAVLLTSWFLVVLVLSVMAVVKTGHIGWSSSSLSWLHLIWITLATDAFFLRRWAQARQMYQDARDGEVRVSFESDTHAESKSAAVLETLPNSGRPWTEENKPAVWRRIGR